MRSEMSFDGEVFLYPWCSIALVMKCAFDFPKDRQVVGQQASRTRS